MQIFTKRRNHTDQPGFQETSTKRPARRLMNGQKVSFERLIRAIKVINYVAPKETKPGKAKKPGKGKALRQAKRHLSVLKERGARPRSIRRQNNKVVRLEAQLETS